MSTLVVDTPRYKWVHLKIRNKYGCAIDYYCDECEGPASDWAHIHGTDPENIDNYKPMCRSCHMIYDSPTQGSKHGNSILTEDDVREIRKLHATGQYRVWQIAAKFGVARQTVTNITSRKKWSHVK